MGFDDWSLESLLPSFVSAANKGTYLGEIEKTLPRPELRSTFDLPDKGSARWPSFRPQSLLIRSKATVQDVWEQKNSDGSMAESQMSHWISSCRYGIDPPPEKRNESE